MSETIGQLKNVDVRSQWPKEESDFTPWLASKFGLALLSDALGLDLELEGTEIPVGLFFADIVAKDNSSNSRVVIENQFGKTDHDHLGKAVTYASGLEAKAIIWIAESFTDEHRRALDFLNETVAPDLLFFGLEMELWRIENSPPAPHFKVISSPNDYLVLVRQEGHKFSDTEILYQKFWIAFKEFCKANGSTLPLQKPQPWGWINISIGCMGFNFVATISKMKGHVGCKLYIEGESAKKAFELLELQKLEIERVTGSLEWQKLPNKSASFIAIHKTGVDLEREDAWEPAFKWLRENAEKLFEAFRDRVKLLDLESEGPEAT